MAASGVRVTVITADGHVLADSQSETRTMESHADRPEVRAAMATGEGQAKRRSVSVGRDLLYYAIRSDAAVRPPLVLRFAAPLTVHETHGTPHAGTANQQAVEDQYCERH